MKTKYAAFRVPMFGFAVALSALLVAGCSDKRETSDAVRDMEDAAAEAAKKSDRAVEDAVKAMEDATENALRKVEDAVDNVETALDENN